MPPTRTHFSLAALTTNTPVTAGVNGLLFGKTNDGNVSKALVGECPVLSNIP